MSPFGVSLKSTEISQTTGKTCRLGFGSNSWRRWRYILSVGHSIYLKMIEGSNSVQPKKKKKKMKNLTQCGSNPRFLVPAFCVSSRWRWWWSILSRRTFNISRSKQVGTTQKKKKGLKISPNAAQTRDSWYRRSAFPVSVVVQSIGGHYYLFEKVRRSCCCRVVRYTVKGTLV